MVTFEFEGNTFECDETAARDYKVIKSMAKARTNPAALFEGFERMFAGRDEEYAEKVGGTLEAMTALFSAALEAAGAKNS